MGLCVDLGLERFYYGDEPGRLEAIERLVRDGFAPILREVFADGRVFEARRHEDRVESRWLSASERAPLLADIERLIGRPSAYASFSWEQLEELGVGPIQDLAFEIADSAPRAVTLPKHDGPSKIMHVTDSLMSWPEGSPDADDTALVLSMHWLASEHHLIVHSA